MARSIISLDTITGSYDISSNLTVNAANLIVSGALSVTGSTYLKNTQIDGYLTVSNGISGSLTKLTDGTNYLIAGSNIDIASGSNGSVTVSINNPEASSIAYNGYCTGSLLWSSTTWADFRGVPGNFTDTIQNGITRSGSTFTVVSGGLYYFRSKFNHNNYQSYNGWRISGSNGTIIQRTSGGGRYNPTDGDGADLTGVFPLSASASFKLQYIYKTGAAPATTFAVSDPIDGESMRTGTISIFRIGKA